MIEVQKDFTETDYDCPVCGRKLFTEATLINNVARVAVWCGRPEIPQPDGYHCREIGAYGKDAKDAFKTVTEKMEHGLKERKK